MNTLSERLAELPGKETGEPWAVCTDATGDTFIASMTDSAETICEFGAGQDDEDQSRLGADAALIVMLVNAYRAGRLIVKDEAHD